MSRFMGGMVLLWAACAPPTGPTPEKTASYLGLQDGKEITYQVQDTAGGSPTTARVNISTDTSFADFLSFKVVERNGGGFIQETITYGATAEDMRLLRMGDCLPACTDFNGPPSLIKNPIVANQTYESNSGTRVTTVGGTSEGPSERHAIAVGDEKLLDTPAGSFRAYEVSWRRFVGGAATSEDRKFYFAPGKGIVGMDKGTLKYRVQGGVSP